MLVISQSTIHCWIKIIKASINVDDKKHYDNVLIQFIFDTEKTSGVVMEK